MNEKDGVTVLATASLLLYLSLSVVCASYFMKFRNIVSKTTVPRQLSFRVNSGLFDEPKMYFFLLLCLSALFDVPLYIACLIRGSPNECEWKGVDFYVFWVFHLIAVCGYAYCIILPSIMWSDMIHKKDGKLFLTVCKMDWMKRYFQICFVLYCLNTCVNIILIIVYYCLTDDPEYVQTTFGATFVSTTESVLLLFISFGCLYSGIQLANHVTSLKLHSRKFLINLNIIMFMVFIAFVGRAVMVILFLSPFVHNFADDQSSDDTILNSDYYYLVWLTCSRWLPYIFCPFCLVLNMRLSGEEIEQYNRQQQLLLQQKGSTSTSNLTAVTASMRSSQSQRRGSGRGKWGFALESPIRGDASGDGGNGPENGVREPLLSGEAYPSPRGGYYLVNGEEEDDSVPSDHPKDVVLPHSSRKPSPANSKRPSPHHQQQHPSTPFLGPEDSIDRTISSGYGGEGGGYDHHERLYRQSSTSTDFDYSTYSGDMSIISSALLNDYLVQGGVDRSTITSMSGMPTPSSTSGNMSGIAASGGGGGSVYPSPYLPNQIQTTPIHPHLYGPPPSNQAMRSFSNEQPTYPSSYVSVDSVLTNSSTGGGGGGGGGTAPWSHNNTNITTAGVPIMQLPTSNPRTYSLSSQRSNSLAFPIQKQRSASRIDWEDGIIAAGFTGGRGRGAMEEGERREEEEEDNDDGTFLSTSPMSMGSVGTITSTGLPLPHYHANR